MTFPAALPTNVPITVPKPGTMDPIAAKVFFVAILIAVAYPGKKYYTTFSYWTDMVHIIGCFLVLCFSVVENLLKYLFQGDF